MNVFVIPSWYPSSTSPVSGIFVRAQIDALAAHRPDWNFIVSTWGHHDSALSVRDAGASIRALRWRWRHRGLQWFRHPHGWEVRTAALSWTLAAAGGGVRKLLAASRRNLSAATARFGPISLMHAHVGFPAGWIAAQLSAETGIPYVLTEHMSPFPFPALVSNSRSIRALRLAFERAAAVIAVSTSLQEKIHATGLPCGHVIANVVDDRRFIPGCTVRQPFVLFTLAAMTHQKGIDTLLRALALWNPLCGDVELRIGGDGPMLASFQRLSAELGVADRVRWLGRVRPQDAPSLFAQCDAFVLASRHETFGVVLAEAITCGKPVVATKSGGPQSIVKDINGRLVDVDDVSALARALEWMSGHVMEFDAVAIRSDAIQRFSPGAVSRKLEALYESVIGRTC